MNSKKKGKKFNNRKSRLCNSDEDRVKSIMNELDESLPIINQWSSEKKSPAESEKLRHSGNRLLNSISPDLEEVLKLYSKSILYAPPGSVQLSLAYANRSAILFRGKYYKECLEDISRALEIGYPEDLKPKLLIRRVTCNYALTGNVDFETDKGLIETRALLAKLPTTNKTRKMLEDTLNNPGKITSVGRQMKKTYPKYQPEMKGRNPHLPGASDAIALKYSRENGKHLIATRDINAGDILLIEKPYVTIIDHKWIYCICSHCARRTWNGIPCDYCIHAMFCSTECKRAAWEEYHDVECAIVDYAKGTGIWANGLMALRMTVKAIKEAGSVGALRKRLKELDSVKESDVEIPINPDSYETFYIMSDHPERIEPVLLRSCSSTAGRLTYFLAAKTDLFEKRLIGGLQEVKDSEEFLFVAGLMSKNMRIAPKRSYGWKVEDKIDRNEDPIITITAVSSFLNNRCYDAAKLLRFDKEMILVTYVPINNGDQVFIQYHASYKDEPRNARRALFNDGWQFTCNCLACKENWSQCSATHWIDQKLPPRIMEELDNEIAAFELPDLEETEDPMKLITAKEKFCRLIDFMYPRVKKPCLNVEIFVDTVNNIHMALSSMTYRRFVDEL